jgi:hypothetical protein
VPLATALGLSGTPGEAAGFGLLDAGTARDLLAAAGRSPHTRWCVTVLHPDGTAAAHGCATGRHPPPPGPEPPGPEPPGSLSPGGASTAAPPPPGPALPGTPDPGTSGRQDQRPPPDTQARDYLRSLRVRLSPIARGNCDHEHAETGYRPSRKLQHLIRTRSTHCTAPGCSRPAARCDLRPYPRLGGGRAHLRVRTCPSVPAPPQAKAGTGLVADPAGTRRPAMANPARTHLHHHPHRVPAVIGGAAATSCGGTRERLRFWCLAASIGAALVSRHHIIL